MTGVPLGIAAAVLWGAVAGALLPRAACRFAVPAGEGWRDRCPEGHALRGWLGPARCGECAGKGAADAELPDPCAGKGTAAAESSDACVDEGAAAAAESSDACAPPYPAGPSDTPGPSVGTLPYTPSAPLLAAVTALLCAALTAATGTRPELAVWLLLAPVGVLLAVVDFRVQRLPDPLTLPLAPVALALLGLAALLPEHAGHWLTALYGAVALGAGYFVLFLVNPSGMGFGDVKLAVGMGAVLGWYGWSVVLLGAFAGFLLGAVYGGALVVVRRAGRRTTIPFGPFLLSGALAGLLIGACAA
ncbi:prepilin peptidase [Streptomyces monashensis]|uniref:Prepilin peptidase n=1 Tax=Streptomyces monashensis TaxID=1678012 RepID=A0A1S2Q679_9ACTN|nr:A24 family peptidase [Streptomyces monashensis]OIK01197.1 prepilin peptidase [Streptomyces monashensis]